MPSGDDHPHSALCPSSITGLPQLSTRCGLAGSNPHFLYASSMALRLVVRSSKRHGSFPMATDCCNSLAACRSSCHRHCRDSHTTGSVSGRGPKFSTARQLWRVTVVFGSLFFLSVGVTVSTAYEVSRSGAIQLPVPFIVPWPVSSPQCLPIVANI